MKHSAFDIRNSPFKNPSPWDGPCGPQSQIRNPQFDSPSSVFRLRSYALPKPPIFCFLFAIRYPLNAVILQNEPNFQKSKTTLTPSSERTYAKNAISAAPRNKPNSKSKIPTGQLLGTSTRGVEAQRPVRRSPLWTKTEDTYG